MKPVLVFDIETIPDTDGLRKAWNLTGSDAEVADAAFARRREQSGHDFLPTHLHRVVAIACVMCTDRGLHVGSLCQAGDPEGVLVARFFDLIEQYTPQLVSWNGGGFDLPVLQYRALVHGVSAPRYWDQGDLERESRYNNYLSRYHHRHLDLMDLLARYGGRTNAPLDELARLCGFPGKMGMDGSQVWPAWQAGSIDSIRNYCETDAFNTWLLYCRWQWVSGRWTAEEYQDEMMRSRGVLEGLAGAHWQEYLARWEMPA